MTNQNPDPTDVIEAIRPDAFKDVQAQELTVKVRPLEKDTPGFMPLWRRILAIRRGLTDLEKACPEDVDAAYSMLCEYIVEPAEYAEKVAILDRINSTEMMAIFDAITGAGKVPPSKGGA